MSTKAAAGAPAPVQAADYGIDAPRVVRQMFTRGIVIFVLGAAIWFMNRQAAPGPGAALFAIIGLIGLGYIATGFVMRWSSTTGKPRMIEQMLDAIPLSGDEKVLDVGCGRGMLLVAAAKRLTKPGRATGVDVWSERDQSGNSADAAAANARAEGVSDRVKIDTGDARKLPYGANSFDVVMSSVALHNLAEPAERDTAVKEMWRVLKPGGHLAIFDIAHTDDYQRIIESQGAEVIRRSGFSMLWMMPSTRWFVARRPAA